MGERVNFQALCRGALAEAARAVSPEVKRGRYGHARRWQDNLFDFGPEAMAAIEADFRDEAGHSIGQRLGAAHSAAALAVNTLGPWRRDPPELRFYGATGFRRIEFACRLEVGLPGPAPQLDALLEGDSPMAVVTKCTEWMRPTEAAFPVPPKALPLWYFPRDQWFLEWESLSKHPRKYRYLDAAQLVLQAFGIMARYHEDPVTLVYLYWEPRNRADWPQCAAFRDELEDFKVGVGTTPVGEHSRRVLDERLDDFPALRGFSGCNVA